MNEKGITQTYRYLTKLMLPNLDIKVGGFDNEGGITFPNKIIDVGNKVERRHGFKSHENLFNENKIIIFQEEIKYEKNIMVLVAFIYTM